MNQENYQLLEELLDREITKLNRDLVNKFASKDLLIGLRLSTDVVDLTITRLSARLELLNETLGQLIDWSNN